MPGDLFILLVFERVLGGDRLLKFIFFNKKQTLMKIFCGGFLRFFILIYDLEQCLVSSSMEDL